MVVLLAIALIVLPVMLKLWACYWLYTFVVAWYTTGVVPSFWSFVWAIILVGFVLIPASSSSSNSK